MLVRKQEQRRRSRGGFTLMEILIVVAIIVVLAALGGVYLFPKLDEAKLDAAKIQIQTLTNSCMQYRLKHDDWPPSLQALTEPSDGNAPLMEPDKIYDPWGQLYSYDPAGPNNGGLKPDIWCQRPNGKMVGNWPAAR